MTPIHTEDRIADRIEKQIEINAPVSRVWRALTNHDEFGAWFRVKLESPFTVGEEAHGPITWPGYEHVTFRAVVQAIDPEQYFAFTWHPYSIDSTVDYSEETPTLVEFHLEKTATGTLLKVTESGFSDVPDGRRREAFIRNNEGWAQQVKNIEEYVTQKP
jgi:uncharacterized protein YndB with AHSA1/START domain